MLHKWAQGTHEEMLVLNSELGDGWLSNYKPLVLVQRIKVQSPAPTSETSQPPVSLVLGGYDSL